ncbi:unnamed protein product [Callosobruchus maculatus]|uniref:Uncharacterized protein n=1 Tax=Callosobruchus maculatus TaxID=64391 RepID=A0A653D7G5_CALMS|nr:unnamed protein product [Callosobruchus maculatus]
MFKKTLKTWFGLALNTSDISTQFSVELEKACRSNIVRNCSKSRESCVFRINIINIRFFLFKPIKNLLKTIFMLLSRKHASITTTSTVLNNKNNFNMGLFGNRKEMSIFFSLNSNRKF